MTALTLAFPGALDDTVSLGANIRGATTTLAAPIVAGDLAWALTSGTGFSSSGVLVIDPDGANREVVVYSTLTGTALSGAVRGVDDTTAASHAAGTQVAQVATAGIREILRDGLIAAETKIGYGASTPTIGQLFVGDTTSGKSRWDTNIDKDTANLTLSARAYGTALFGSWVTRKARGSFAAPRRTKSGDNMGRFGSSGFNAADDSTNATEDGANRVYLQATALEDHTSTAQGARWDVFATAVGATAPVQVAQLAAGSIVLSKPAVMLTERDVTAYSSFQAAMDVGPGLLVNPNGNNLTLSAAGTLQPGVVFANYGTITAAAGLAGGTLFTTPPGDPIKNFRMFGGVIDPGGTIGLAKIFNLHSPERCDIDVTILDAGTATTGFYIRSDATNLSGYDGNANAVFNRITAKMGTIGTGFDTAGFDRGGGTLSYCTLNSFPNCDIDSIQGTGFLWGALCDTQHLGPNWRGVLRANNAIGIDLAGTTTAYNVFGSQVAVDAFTGGGYTGRIQLRLGGFGAKNVNIDGLYCNPAAEGGAIVDLGTTTGLYIRGNTVNTSVPSNSVEVYGGTTLYHINTILQTLSTDVGFNAIVRAEHFVNGGTASVRAKTRTSGGTIVEAIITSDPGGTSYLGTSTAHPAIFLGGNTEVFRLPGTGASLTLADAKNIAVGTSTGSKIGTVGGAAGQKLGFWNATPVVQPLLATGAGKLPDDIITVLQTLGLVRQS